MFYFKTMTHEVPMSPKAFGPKLKENIKSSVRSTVEGTALPDYGYVVAVLDISEEKIAGGVIEYDTGDVLYTVTFQALMFRPFKGEVLDTVVENVNQMGLWGYAGPLKVFVSRRQLPSDLTDGYDAERSSYVSEDHEVEIQVGSCIRARVMNATLMDGHITAAATMKDDYLGLSQL